MSTLSHDEIRKRLASLTGWERAGREIRKDHHPDILINYSRVTLTPSSHDAGGLTERDFRLAGQIDA
jgi:4a-hydroxytetrahydrobiopterin dehydratase